MNDELLPCPMCGATSGYLLSEGSTVRWWSIACKDCGRSIGECRSDRRFNLGWPIPNQDTRADKQWNEAAAYAESLRRAVHSKPTPTLLPDDVIERIHAFWIGIDGVSHSGLMRSVETAVLKANGLVP